MIRDLQARSGARMDVDQSAQPGLPRTITYQGPRSKVEFAKKLVGLVAAGATEATLPLGEAKREAITIPASTVGKVIGRNGEIVRELQSRSHAKVDFDHSDSRGMGSENKVVLLTGTVEAVAKAKEMVAFLAANPEVEAVQALNMLVDEKLRTATPWGSGPPYRNLPNQGAGMKPEMLGGSRSHVGASNDLMLTPAVLTQNTYQMGSASRSELIYCKKQYIGRIIGSKGSTIKDLQQRSGSVIQIKQDVPYGADCEVTISGSNDGVEMAKQMIQQIIQGGADHLFGLGGKSSARAVGTVNPGYQQNYSQGHTYGQQQSHMQSSSIYQAPTSYAPHQHSDPGHMQQGQQRIYPSTAAKQDNTSPQLRATPVASDWKKMVQPGGRAFYWNEKTGATTWDKPPGF